MIEDIIRERDKTHGDWTRQSQLSHDLKRRIAQEQPDLTASQYEALEMIVVKMARIVCGDANEPDHWRDLSGYATLGGSE
jgi:hypothetical protein